MATAGYSKTPLVKKLGIKPNFNCWLISEPKQYFDLLMDIPQGAVFNSDDTKKPFDFVHLFITDHDELKEIVENIRHKLVTNGMLWISWPKGKSKIPKSTNETFIRNIVLETDLVDVKVCAVDEDWSGLKFVIRKEKR